MSITKAEECPICGRQTGALAKSSLRYNKKHVCQTCCKKLADAGVNLLKVKKMSLEDLRKMTGNTDTQRYVKAEVEARFRPTRSVSRFLEVDDEMRVVSVPTVSLTGKVVDRVFVPFGQIEDFELISDGVTKTKADLVGAAVGGLMLATVHFAVLDLSGKKKEYCTELKMVVWLRDSDNPKVTIDFLKGAKLDAGGGAFEYLLKQVDEVIAILDEVSSR